MDNVLQTALAEAVNSLASFFGTTTETVMTHAPEFLAKYGWYDTLNRLPITILLCVLGCALLFIILQVITEFQLDLPLHIIIIACFICVVIVIGCQIVTCMVAPEIVGAHAVLELLKNMG